MALPHSGAASTPIAHVPTVSQASLPRPVPAAERTGGTGIDATPPTYELIQYLESGLYVAACRRDPLAPGPPVGPGRVRPVADKRSIKRRRKRAAWDPQYLLDILGPLQPKPC